ncbi:heat stress transcription factor B-1-like [Ananas comosus]|uniref:Heat stress transcription factor B-1-like n=2 Tax=Ananas comosus TaxID=4615 RepID=A0A6P5F1Z5_ANACO|nr:heat stress transcription factor B-1-like [Ananas comosus]CAD1827023.1 unnamed protein product [Ananas comosus var. bracteatus]
MTHKGKGSGSGSGGSGPAPFLMKTHEMVEAAETDDVISWGEEGRSFVVWKPVEFARDLLPLHFKHNNFSSFVRQLNTYGFRKVVPHRWEFANESFRRGEQGLLSSIRRRKAAPPLPQSPQPGTSGCSAQLLPPPPPLLFPPSSVTNSGDVHSSSSTSSPSPPPPPTQKLAQLSHENEQLKKHNQILSTELAQAKQQCDELLGFLSKFVDVRGLNFDLLMQENAAAEETTKEREDAVERKEEAKEGKLKLFGVILKGLEVGEGNKGGMRKRGLCEEGDACGVDERRPMKMGFGAPPWMGVSAAAAAVQQRGGKVCN